MNATLLDDTITQLSSEEKLVLIGKLWQSLNKDSLPVPPEVVAELERRRAAYERNPGSALTLDEVLARVRRKL